MTLNTGDPCYSDLFEWQLYNAAAVGMGLDGKSFLYNNPLLCKGGVTRQPWFNVPCCPSNLSRTWASLGKYIYSYDKSNLWVHQYLGNQARIEDEGWTANLASKLPWDGEVRFSLDLAHPSELSVHFRLPSWSKQVAIRVNSEPFNAFPATSTSTHLLSSQPAASGYDPRQARYIQVHRTWSPGEVVDLDFDVSISLRRPSPSLRGHKGKVVLTRGPLVYCLESVDNPGIDIFSSRIDTDSVHAEYIPDLLSGICVLGGRTTEGFDFRAIPYHLWANRGASTMTVWVKE
jgi:hypothetical protein